MTAAGNFGSKVFLMIEFRKLQQNTQKRGTLLHNITKSDTYDYIVLKCFN